MDLNQFVLSMVSNQHGIPMFVQTHSGNSSDKKTIIEAIRRVKEGLDFNDDNYFVADSALYSYENINHLGDKIPWITRVPAIISEAKDLLDADIEMICDAGRKSLLYSLFFTPVMPVAVLPGCSGWSLDGGSYRSLDL